MPTKKYSKTGYTISYKRFGKRVKMGGSMNLFEAERKVKSLKEAGIINPRVVKR